MKLTYVISEYFKERCLFFHSSDEHKNIEGDTYLTYQRIGDKVALYFGSDNGEICITVTDNAQKLETLIRNIIY